MSEHHATLSVATWNVNSVKSRLAHLLQFLAEEKPDVVLLQELKCVDESFPCLEVGDVGYNIATHGEKTYNGVAILSRLKLEDVRRGLPGDETDTQARYIEGVVNVPAGAVRVASVYVPNGQSLDSDKFAYKLRFLDRLRAHLSGLRAYEEPVVIGGDYNIAPFAADVHAPAAWNNSVLFHESARAPLRRLLNEGWYDAWRMSNPAVAEYSWWDYRANSFAQDEGLRIDHLLLSPQAADRLDSCHISKRFRALEKASDHAPVVATLRAA